MRCSIALSQYQGTLVFISHDVILSAPSRTSVLHINAGKLTPYAGDYDYYLDKSKATPQRAALTKQWGNDRANGSRLRLKWGDRGQPPRLIPACAKRANVAAPKQKSERPKRRRNVIAKNMCANWRCRY